MKIGSPEWRNAVGESAKGKVIESLEWVSDPGITAHDGYWVMTFTDGAEISFSLTMAEEMRR